MKKLSVILLILFALDPLGAAFADDMSGLSDAYIDKLVDKIWYGGEAYRDCYKNCLKMMHIAEENCAARTGKKPDSDECHDEGVEFFIKCELRCDWP